MARTFVGADSCSSPDERIISAMRMKSVRTLLGNPELANDPQIAATILARFLSDREDRVREALAADPKDLATARRLVNGGSNGLDRFIDAFNRGMQVIPEPASTI